MKRHLATIFNIFCLGFLGLFATGTFFVWQRALSASIAPIVIQQTVEKPLLIPEEPVGVVEETEVVEEGEEVDEEIKEEDVASVASSAQLSVPFTSQAPEFNWDQPWQDACEEAAILMIDAYYKDYKLSPVFARDEMLKMIDWETEQGHGYSIPATVVRDVAKMYGDLDLAVIKNPTVELIKKSIQAGHPVLVLAHGKSLPNPYFSSGGPNYHALVVTGYDEGGFITNDPGTKRGEHFYYKTNGLMPAIHDWNDGNVEQGTPVVLIHTSLAP